MKVIDFCIKDISSVTENISIRNVIRMMDLTRDFSIPIVNKNNKYMSCIDISAIIDQCIPSYMKSILNTSFLPDFSKFADNLKSIIDKPIYTIMPDSYPTLSYDDTINYAADLLEKSETPMLPVLKGDQLIGKITRLELLSFALKKEFR